MKAITKNILVSAISGGLSATIVAIFLLSSTDQLPPSVKPADEDAQNTTPFEILSNKEFVSEQNIITSVVEKSTPAVVSIIITKDVPVLEQYYDDFGHPFNSPFDSFFGGPSFNFKIPKYRESGETEEKELGGGSGFIVSSDGYIVTNKHVVDEPDADYTVFMNDGSEFTAEIIDKDSLNDIAILKIQGEDFPYLKFGNSEDLKAGQTAIAIGNPLLEFNNSVSVGVISGLSRNITAGSRFYGKTEYLEDVIQTDAAINPGNSGGPLLDIHGKVIGVNVAVANGENIGFSIPSNLVKNIAESVEQNGRIIRPFLGVRYVQVTESLKEKNNLSVDHGVLVLRGETLEDLAVIPGSPADKAGIVENDIILEVNGEKLDDSKSLAKIISSKNVGDELELKIFHKGKEKTVTVTLEEPEEQSKN